jgi:two-component system, cell cycle sensor histidine kinase and response regulator CckA
MAEWQEGDRLAQKDADRPADHGGGRCRMRRPLHKRIIFWVVVPVLIVGAAISGMLIAYLSPPITFFLERHFNANLRLATDMGMDICESSFNYLLELRFEDNPEMNLALKNEALKEIQAIGRKVPDTHMMVMEGGRAIMVSSPGIGGQHTVDGLRTDAKSIVTFSLDHKAARAVVRYFPFWNWHVVSFVFEDDYNRPVHTAFSIIYLGTAGVLVSVLLALIFTYLRFVNRPLEHLIAATRGISAGEYQKVEKIADNEIGQLTASFNSMVDGLATEKKAVRDLIHQLKISESLFRTLFENAPLGICLAERNGLVVKSNHAMQMLIGRSEERMAAMDFGSIFRRADDYAAVWSRLESGGTVVDHETYLKHSDGGFRQVRMMLTMMASDQQELLLAIIEDISEQKKLETQLNQSRKLEAIGSLAGGIAHDFNNLLSPIMGYGELLLDDFAPDDKRRLSVEEIVKASQKARDIVRQLLAFSRKQMLRFESTDLNKVIADFEKLLRRTIREDIALRIQLCPGLPLIEADEGQLIQVLMNLTVNAQDAMPRGGRIVIETAGVDLDEQYGAQHQSVVPGRYVLLAVSDTGQGMDANTLGQIFTPFFTTKEKGQGTGFGLATVYGIVKQHGGYIWAYSEPGSGSTFKIYFPIAEEKSGQAAFLPVCDAEEQERVGGTILVVEDDPGVRDLVITILQRRGYGVLSASSPAECLRMLQTRHAPIDMMLTDVIMPEMNGKELFMEVSKLVPGVAVIFMSGYTDEVIAHHGVLEDGVNFIQKPFSAKDLLAKVDRLLKQCMMTPLC